MIENKSKTSKTSYSKRIGNFIGIFPIPNFFNTRGKKYTWYGVLRGSFVILSFFYLEVKT